MTPRCTHLDQVRDVTPRTPDGCEECLASGDGWVQLRLCLSCGHVGCCDSSSNRHATKHHRSTGHPIIRSFQPGERWLWCYVDEMVVKPPQTSIGSPMPRPEPKHEAAWPALPYAEWRDTLATLHMWSQIVGKIRLALAPPVNHGWHVTLQVTPRGLTTGTMARGTRFFEIDFDLVAHACRIVVSDGRAEEIALRPMSVADFHEAVMSRLARLGLEVEIWTRPVEVEDPIRFEQDRRHASYDAAAVSRCFQALAGADRVLRTFRGGFIGKSSPVHFFWGSFDLAVTRFSGRTAPEHPGGVPNLADRVTREAYSHELFSAGWWPGNAAFPEAAFYAYAYPEPEGFGDVPRLPDGAFYHPQLREYLLPWPVVGAAADPEGVVLAFLETTYAAAADLGAWDRRSLERA